MQRAIVVRANDEIVKILNDKYLADGWKVISSCPMPSSTGDGIGDIIPTCLVVIEKI